MARMSSGERAIWAAVFALTHDQETTHRHDEDPALDDPTIDNISDMQTKQELKQELIAMVCGVIDAETTVVKLRALAASIENDPDGQVTKSIGSDGFEMLRDMLGLEEGGAIGWREELVAAARPVAAAPPDPGDLEERRVLGAAPTDRMQAMPQPALRLLRAELADYFDGFGLNMVNTFGLTSRWDRARILQTFEIARTIRLLPDDVSGCQLTDEFRAQADAMRIKLGRELLT